MPAVHVLSLVAFIAGVCYFSGASLVQLFDLYSFLSLVCITVLVILSSGRWKSVCSVWGILRGAGKKHTLEELKNAGDSLKLLMIVPAICSFCIAMIGVIGIIYNLEDSSKLAESLLLSFVPVLYSCIIALALLPVYSRIIILQNKSCSL